MRSGYTKASNVAVAHCLPNPFDPKREAESRAVSEVFNYYSVILSEHEAALQYLCERGITDIELLNEHQIGFADRTLGQQLQQLTHMEEQAKRGALQRVGLFKSSGHEFFRGSLIFPFYNDYGKAVSAYGRRIADRIRLNGKPHQHWYMDDEVAFFNQEALSEHHEVILCKSPLEVLVWLSNGFDNAVGTMGYKSYNSKHIDSLKAHGVSKVLIAFGTSREELIFARKANLLNIKAGIESRMIVLPDGLDTCGYAMSVDKPFKGLNKAYKQPFVLD